MKEPLNPEIMSKDELVELVVSLSRAGDRLRDAYTGAIWKHEGKTTISVGNELACRNWENAKFGRLPETQ